MKRMIAVVLLLAVLLSAGIPPASRVKASENTRIPQGYEKVVQSGNLALYMNYSLPAILVEDRRNGYVWKSAVDSSMYNMESTNDQWKTYMTSLFTIQYADLSKPKGEIQQAFSADSARQVRMSKLNNGVELTHDFTSLGIEISFEIKLEDDELIVRIPADKIKEKGKNGLVRIEWMPFFGAADRKVDGYILYPDGSGALMRYGNIQNRARTTKPYRLEVYSPEKVDVQKSGAKTDGEEYQAMLPVFGVKNADNAFAAYAADGAEDAAITLSPEGMSVDLNRISFEFTYRHQSEIILSDLKSNGVSLAKKPNATKVDKQLEKRDRVVRYSFLSGSQANYNGMAQNYRNYLLKSSSIKKVIDKKEGIPLGIDLFMGIKEDGILFDRFLKLTDFKQAQQITAGFVENGVKNIQVNLKGWTDGGYGLYPVNWPPEKRLGGSKGLSDLNEYCSRNRIDLFLQTNFQEAYSKVGGFSKRNDVVILGNKLPATNLLSDLFLFNPMTALKRFESFMTASAKQRTAGVAFEGIGQRIYHDYNKKSPLSRTQTVEAWEKMLERTVADRGSAAVVGGNLYALKYADRLMSIPVESSQNRITDEDIPFYQLVVHGLIPYSSTPGNLFHDSARQKLQWVEYGCIPYFELTYERPLELKYTNYNKLFASHYEEWVQRALEIYKEFTSRLEDIWGEQMLSHERLNKDVYRVEYANGSKVYINYGEKETVWEGIRIKALDYTVVGKGGAVK